MRFLKYLLILVIMFGVCALLAASFNPAEWGWGTRALLAAVIVGIVYDEFIGRI